MKHVCLITGGAGLIGVNVASELVSQGVDVIVLDNLEAYPIDYLFEFGLKSLNVEFVRGDIGDFDLVRSLVHRSSCVIHLAALADVAACTRNPAQEFSVNVQGVHNLLEALRGSSVKRVVFASSASVYGSPLENSIVQFSESGPTDPISLYGSSKLWGEKRVFLYAKTFGISAVALRLFSVYGSPQVPKQGSHSWCVAIFMMQRMISRQTVIYGDGTQIRDFVHVKDIARAFCATVLLPEITEFVVNIGSGVPTRIGELYENISKLVPSDGPHVIYKPRREDDPYGGYADTAQAKHCLRWQTSIDLRNGLQEYTAWLRDHKHLIPSFL